MILIAHRGNLHGPSPDENKPEHILDALAAGFHAEVDVWWHGLAFWLGHDRPQYPVHKAILQDSRVWCHAKDVFALHFLRGIGAHHFWHEKDAYTLTSKGYVWAYPGKIINGPVSDGFIAVKPELVPHCEIRYCGGVCSDYVARYRQ